MRQVIAVNAPHVPPVQLGKRLGIRAGVLCQAGIFHGRILRLT
jgi:hypothetical protein